MNVFLILLSMISAIIVFEVMCSFIIDKNIPKYSDLRLGEALKVISCTKTSKVMIKSLYNDYEYYDYNKTVKRYGRLFLDSEVENVNSVNDVTIITINDKEVYLLEVKRGILEKRGRRNETN